jgi:hypothetical protein
MMRQALGAALAVALVAVTAAPRMAEAASPDEVLCLMMSESATTVNAAGPVAIDALTTQEHVSVDCGSRTILTRFTRKDSADDQPAGWQARWQSQLDATYCGDATMRDIIRSGWTLAETTEFADGVELEIKAACE